MERFNRHHKKGCGFVPQPFLRVEKCYLCAGASEINCFRTISAPQNMNLSTSIVLQVQTYRTNTTKLSSTTPPFFVEGARAYYFKKTANVFNGTREFQTG